jgi:hypothetical protein
LPALTVLDVDARESDVAQIQASDDQWGRFVRRSGLVGAFDDLLHIEPAQQLPSRHAHASQRCGVTTHSNFYDARDGGVGGGLDRALARQCQRRPAQRHRYGQSGDSQG